MHARLRRPRPALAVLAAALAFGALACGGGTGDSAGPATATALTVAPTGSPGPITLEIVSPAEGATVTNPFTLKVQATGIQIAASSQGVPSAAHFDAFLDKDPVAEGQLVPSGSGIFHFTDSVELRAASGKHTVTVVLSDNDHLRLQGAPTAKVTLTVGEGG